jgi:hypothetical protein
MTEDTGFLDPAGAIVGVWAGATGADPHRGQLVVWISPRDPCTSTNPDGTIRSYLTATDDGPLRIVSVSGNIVTVRTNSRRQNRLNIHSGWLPN